MQLERAVSAGSVLKVTDERGAELIRLGIAHEEIDATQPVVEQKPVEPKHDLTPPLKTEDAYQVKQAEPEVKEVKIKKEPKHTKAELEKLSYRELQDLATSLGIKANQRARKLIKEISFIKK